MSGAATPGVDYQGRAAIDREVTAFEEALKAGQPLSARAALDAAALPETLRATFVEELIAAELEHRRLRLGEWPSEALALAEFPAYPEQVAAAFHVEWEGRLGPYRLWRRVSEEGAMSEVFLALPEREDRLVVLKALHPKLADHSEFAARFRFEGIVLERRIKQGELSHQNIVEVLAHGEDPPVTGRPYFVMPYYPGGSLRRLLEQRGRALEPAEAARYIEQAARGLAHAHAQGIVHRDVKPSNILIDTKARHAWIADFGLARDVDGQAGLSTDTGAMLGAFGYSAPEQIINPKAADGASDVYSLGVTLYEAIVGRRPHVADGIPAMLEAIRRRTPARPPAVPRPLATICLKCLEPYPSWRYRTAGELADDLDRFLQGKRIRAWWWPATAPLKWFRRHAAASTILGLLVVSLAVAGVALALHRGDLRLRRAMDRLRLSEAAATAARTQADREFTAARQVLEKLTNLADSPDLRAHLPTVRADLLANAEDFYRAYLQSHADDPKLSEELARILGRLASINLDSNDPRRLPEAEDQFRKAAARWKTLGPPFRAQHAEALHGQATAMQARVTTDASSEGFGTIVELYTQAAQIFRELADARSPSAREWLTFKSKQARAYGYLGDVYLAAGELPPAETTYQRSHMIRTRLHRLAGDEPDSTFQLARSWNNLARLASEQGDLELAVAHYGEAVKLQSALPEKVPRGPSPGDPGPEPYQYQDDQAATFFDLALVLRERGRTEAALDSLQQAESRRAALVASYPRICRFRVELARTLGERAALEPADQSLASLDAASKLLAEVSVEEKATDNYRSVEARLDAARAQIQRKRDLLHAVRERQVNILKAHPLDRRFRDDLYKTEKALAQLDEVPDPENNP